MVPFYKGTNHFLVELNGTREADGLASKSLVDTRLAGFIGMGELIHVLAG